MSENLDIDNLLNSIETPTPSLGLSHKIANANTPLPSSPVELGKQIIGPLLLSVGLIYAFKPLWLYTTEVKEDGTIIYKVKRYETIAAITGLTIGMFILWKYYLSSKLN